MTTIAIRERATFGGLVSAPVPFRIPEELRGKLRDFSPRTHLGRIVRECFTHLPADLAGELIDAISQVVIVESSLALVKIYGLTKRREDYGVVCRRLVTDTGVGYIVDAFQNLVELENMKYHGLGTGVTAEAASQTALVTELTTEYTGNVRATGTTAETSAPVFQSVGTNTLDSGTPVIREHGLFSASSVGVMLDRSLFAAISLDGTVGDSLQSDYRLTLTSGG